MFFVHACSLCMHVLCAKACCLFFIIAGSENIFAKGKLIKSTQLKKKPLWLKQKQVFEYSSYLLRTSETTMITKLKLYICLSVDYLCSFMVNLMETRYTSKALILLIFSFSSQQEYKTNQYNQFGPFKLSLP